MKNLKVVIQMMRTTTLYNYIQSELIKKGLNEFVNDEGELVFFDSDNQFMTKILKYDEDVSDIVDHLFSNESLDKDEHDEHFKKIFIYCFIDRKSTRINSNYVSISFAFFCF